jgi:lipopolysaccharide transport system ATP-binding protein
MSTVIQIDNLWKEYRLGVIGHGTLRADLQSWWAKISGKEDPNSTIPMLAGQEKQIEGNRFWALRGIEMEIKQGEILGIIGKNGAGKSTLLKILSRVTAPTQGSIKVKGRIASLLEVGTGFHPELTGRENVFMNGAILGMSKQEINSKLDEIVHFSGVEDFIDTPVKRYSSGMYVRLAFAVAAHLEPEILIVDEVLAVGDAEFQKKCLGKMREINTSGRTVLFVSHNLNSVQKLCTSVTVLANGQEWYSSDDVENAIAEYEKISIPVMSKALVERQDRTGEGRIKIVEFTTTNKDGVVLDSVRTGQDIKFNFHYKIFDQTIKVKDVIFSLTIYSRNGNALTMLGNHLSGEKIELNKHSEIVSCSIDNFPLTEGSYDINLIIRNDRIAEDYIVSAYKLDVSQGDFYRRGGSIKYAKNSVLLDCNWCEK